MPAIATKMKKKAKLHYPFRRKLEETPYEALERLEIKWGKCAEEYKFWHTKITQHAIYTTQRLQENLEYLNSQRALLLDEIEQRRKELIEAFPNANVVSGK